MTRGLFARGFFLGIATSIACAPAENPREPVVRFTSRELGVDFARRLEGPAARAEATRLAAEAETVGRADPLGRLARLRRAVDLAPGDAALRHELIAAFERLEDPEGALAVAREGLRATPSDPGVLFDLGRLVRATIARRGRGDLQAGLDAWRKLIGTGAATPEASRAKAELPALEAALRNASPERVKVARPAEPADEDAKAPTKPGEPERVAPAPRAPSRDRGASPPPEAAAKPEAIAKPETFAKAAAPAQDMAPPEAAAPPAAAAPSETATEGAGPVKLDTSDADDAIFAGNAFLERGLPADAAKSYARALAARPDDETRWLLGFAQRKAGDAAAAARTWQPLKDKGALSGARAASYEAARKEAEGKR